MTIIMGVDPGKTTGVAIVKAYGPSQVRVLSSAQVYVDDAPAYFDEMLNGSIIPIDFVSMEKFTVSLRTMKSSRQDAPLDVIGGVKFLVALHDRDIKLLRYGPNDAKTAYSDKRLKELKLFNSVAGPHARDALRHALIATHILRRSLPCSTEQKELD